MQKGISTKEFIFNTGNILKKIAIFIKDKWLEQKYLFTLIQSVTAAFILTFFLFAPFPKSFLGFVYVLSIFGYYGFSILIAYIILFPFSLNRFTRIIIPLLAWLWFLFLTSDLITFNMFKSHINMLLLEVILLDFTGIGIPLKVTIIASFVFLLLLAFLIYFQIKTTKKKNNKRKAKLFVITTMLVPILLFGLNSIIHIKAYNKRIETITVYNYYPPIYLPMTKSNRTPIDNLNADNNEDAFSSEENLFSSDSDHILSYPQSVPEFDNNTESKKSILLILLESWRYDSVSYETMPNLYDFSKTATVFNKHLSSGNTTICGLFGLFYGVHCGMYNVAKNNPYTYRSVFSKSLFENGYKLNIYTLSSLKRFQVKTMLFDDAKIENIHNVGTDRLMVDALMKDIKENDANELNFYFLFLVSSHFPYKCDPKFAVYEDVSDNVSNFVLNKEDEIKNLKKSNINCLHYEDYLLGDIFKALEEKGISDDLWIIISGDHGEEFNDRGTLYWGHGKEFNKFQTQVPMYIKKPGQTNREEVNYISLHQDIVPTLMEEVLKTKTKESDYSNGTNIFKLTHDRGTVAYSYFDSGYIFDNVAVDKLTRLKYSFETGKVLSNPLTKEEKEKIKELFNEELRFLRKN
jgi:membrane-anchored protein YejM (alkaline phosphatase superfamily)